MANFLWNLGAGIRGVQEYEALLQQQELTKQQVELGKARLDEIKEATAEAKKQRERQPTVAQGTLDYLASVGAVPPGTAPGLPQGIPPVPPPVQAPPPGQQSQPMMRLPMIGPDDGLGMPPPPPVPQGPPGPIPQGGPPMPPQGAPMPVPSGPPVGPGMPPGPPPGVPQGQPPIPPYQTVGGVPGGVPGGPPPGMGIPPPPMPPQPRPNSMSLQDAAQFIQARGISDPVTGLQILGQLTPYLNDQAKQEAAGLRLEMAQQKLEADKARDERIAKDKTLDREQREAAAKRIDETRRTLGNMRMVPRAGGKGAAGTGAPSAAAGAKPGAVDREDDIEVQAWKFLTKGENPPARSPDYKPIMQRVALIAKENGLSPQEIISASADVKSKLAAKKNFEVRAQNMERAENQILAEIPLIRDSIKQINLPSIPIFAKAGIAGLRQLGDPRITALDQAVETVFNEFEGIRTGNPGALNVSDVQNAHKAYENAKTPQQMEAAVKGIERTIENAKKAMGTTRKHILDDINATFKKEGLAGHAKDSKAAAPAGGGAIPQGWSVKVK